MVKKRDLVLARIQGRIQQLPLLPSVLMRALRLDLNAEDLFDRLLALLRADPAFAVRLMRIANSASVSPAKEVRTLNQALTVVGCNATINLITLHSAMRVFVPSHDWERDLWRHAFDVACLMQSLALKLKSGIDPDQAYLAGLLHDIGRFILYLEAPEALREVDETAWSTPQQLVEAEMAICGFDHAELGFLALQKWTLPLTLALTVRYHHVNQSHKIEMPEQVRPIILLLQFADWISFKWALHGELWRTASTEEISRMLREIQCRAPINLLPSQLLALVRGALEQSKRMQVAFDLAPLSSSHRH